MTVSPLFEVSPAIFERFPDYIVGCVVARGIDNARANPAIDDTLRNAEGAVAATYGGIDPKRIDEIAVWRDAFATCGWTPSKYPSSIEALLKRVSRGQPLPRVSPIVDLSNACSLTHRVPIGSHDILALRGTLTVRPSEPGDTFVPMGESPPETPDVGEIVYVAGHSVRTRRWVWRQGRDALISPTTTDVFFPIDGFESTTGPNVRAAMAWLADRIEELFGARAQTGLVHSGSRCFANT